MKKPVISLDSVWKTYQMGEVSVHALRGLDLNVYEEEFIAIQGPSGSGKSTAMNLIGCLDTPSKGKIHLDGQDISKLSRSDLSQIRGQKIGFVFQKFNLIPTLSALDNVALPLIFLGWSKSKRTARAKKLLTMTGLGDRIHHKPNELSGGQQQRVAIARSLAADPKVILADEPTGNLDSKTGKEVMLMFKRLHKEEKKTIIFVTHDDKLAKQADRIARIQDGKIVSG